MLVEMYGLPSWGAGTAVWYAGCRQRMFHSSSKAIRYGRNLGGALKPGVQMSGQRATGRAIMQSRTRAESNLLILTRMLRAYLRDWRETVGMQECRRQEWEGGRRSWPCMRTTRAKGRTRDATRRKVKQTSRERYGTEKKGLGREREGWLILTNCGLRLSSSQAHCGTLGKSTRIYRAAVNHLLSAAHNNTSASSAISYPQQLPSSSDNCKQTLTLTRRLHRVVPCSSGPSQLLQLLQLAVRYPPRIGPHTTPPPPSSSRRPIAPDCFRCFFTCPRSAPVASFAAPPTHVYRAISYILSRTYASIKC